jgi:hypothetical protein
MLSIPPVAVGPHIKRRSGQYLRTSYSSIQLLHIITLTLLCKDRTAFSNFTTMPAQPWKAVWYKYNSQTDGMDFQQETGYDTILSAQGAAFNLASTASRNAGTPGGARPITSFNREEINQAWIMQARSGGGPTPGIYKWTTPVNGSVMVQFYVMGNGWPIGKAVACASGLLPRPI